MERPSTRKKLKRERSEELDTNAYRFMRSGAFQGIFTRSRSEIFVHKSRSGLQRPDRKGNHSKERVIKRSRELQSIEDKCSLSLVKDLRTRRVFSQPSISGDESFQNVIEKPKINGPDLSDAVSAEIECPNSSDAVSEKSETDIGLESMINSVLTAEILQVPCHSEFDGMISSEVGSERSETDLRLMSSIGEVSTTKNQVDIIGAGFIAGKNSVLTPCSSLRIVHSSNSPAYVTMRPSAALTEGNDTGVSKIQPWNDMTYLHSFKDPTDGCEQDVPEATPPNNNHEKTSPTQNLEGFEPLISPSDSHEEKCQNQANHSEISLSEKPMLVHDMEASVSSGHSLILEAMPSEKPDFNRNDLLSAKCCTNPTSKLTWNNLPHSFELPKPCSILDGQLGSLAQDLSPFLDTHSTCPGFENSSVPNTSTATAQSGCPSSKFAETSVSGNTRLGYDIEPSITSDNSRNLEAILSEKPDFHRNDERSAKECPNPPRILTNIDKCEVSNSPLSHLFSLDDDLNSFIQDQIPILDTPGTCPSTATPMVPQQSMVNAQTDFTLSRYKEIPISEKPILESDIETLISSSKTDTVTLGAVPPEKPDFNKNDALSEKDFITPPSKSTWNQISHSFEIPNPPASRLFSLDGQSGSLIHDQICALITPGTCPGIETLFASSPLKANTKTTFPVSQYMENSVSEKHVLANDMEASISTDNTVILETKSSRKPDFHRNAKDCITLQPELNNTSRSIKIPNPPCFRSSRLDRQPAPLFPDQFLILDTPSTCPCPDNPIAPLSVEVTQSQCPMSQQEGFAHLEKSFPAPSKGGLTSDVQVCKGLCLCADCACFHSQAERACDFYRKQMQNIEEVIAELMKEFMCVRNLMEKHISLVPGRTEVSMIAVSQVRRMLRQISKTEELAKNRLREMTRKLNLHTRSTRAQLARVKFTKQVEEKFIPNG
ncbi:hypothetical protein AMTRI_Chr06g194860 [Amborella trichopoda]|uniref:uncharacterized protein LOC110007617 n=1 Tax=Amborella trichopoda TaxID=13333 RepID=UPI0009BD8057|nr:uncharacterized protein LOC110007617 [Amborella trichopoda]|eukprot:XP_020525389.1 uncharacterized protein LOC110007617 [Amborella trichopoda]